ncbi:hypothetical protein ACQZ61_06425 [Agrobacterium vitis]|uniref:hypothetical protein n=1 Tax=Agrobacterium vitis TaxID=373 RepID=UPI0015DA698C|nr:hypothetical protein [Agrobacterium vitis]MCF1454080.1 hypothetical protein [Agrobacterium vitis]BCH55276.1 hypothetical protein RvVAR031_28860 [Agrobacterium vitis]
MSDFISVTLTGPAKIDGQRQPAGATVTVSTTLALQLAASGVINPELAKSLAEAVQDTPLASDFQAAVDAAVAERIATLESKTAEELATAQRQIAELDQETENLTADLADAITRLGKADARVAELEKLLAAAQATPAEDTTAEGAEQKPVAKPAKATK